jgi:hypothetical protein
MSVMTRIDILASRKARKARHCAMAKDMGRDDIARMFDDGGQDVSAELLEWSARQALEDYARFTSPAKAAALAGSFITEALGGSTR